MVWIYYYPVFIFNRLYNSGGTHVNIPKEKMIISMTNEAKVLTGIIIVTVALIIGAVFFLSKPEKPVVIDSSHLLKGDALQISTPSAKLTIVEFGDLECPACKLAHPGLKQIIAEYAGKINFVFRNYP